jgi:uncharacterized SAM-binding protein YcdF (DUF218 family)
MFSPDLCNQRMIDNVPLLVEWWQFEWLKKPLLLFLIILAFLGIRWLSKRGKHWINKPKILLFLFGFTATIPLMLILASKGLVAFIPTDSGTGTDAIVVLGRGGPYSPTRVNIAAELWRSRRAPMIFASGNEDAISMIDQLETKGIPRQVLDGEDCSLTTEENAVLTTAILKSQGIRQILLVTDPPHMLRSLLLFRAFGFTVIPHTSPTPAFFDFKTKAFITLREGIGLIGYGLRGLYFPQQSPEKNKPDLVSLVHQAEQYGQQRRLQQDG